MAQRQLVQVRGRVFLEVGQLVGLATALDPRVFECLRGGEALFGIEHEHLLDEVLGCQHAPRQSLQLRTGQSTWPQHLPSADTAAQSASGNWNWPLRMLACNLIVFLSAKGG